MPLFRNRFSNIFADPSNPNPIDCGGLQYCHQFIPGDILRAQFYQTPCGNDALCDPLFNDLTIGADLLGGDGMGGTIVCGNWTLGANWSCDVNELTFTPGVSNAATYVNPGMTVGNIYRVEFTITLSAGSVEVVLGAGGDSTTSAPIDVTGTYSLDMYFEDVGTDSLSFLATDDFDGTITDITLKLITYSCWEPSAYWTFSEGMACKTSDLASAILTESVAAYTTIDGYYSLAFRISGYGGEGSLVAKVAGVTDQDTTVITSNGDYILYFETGISGVVSFEATADFLGCIEFVGDQYPGLYELRRDYMLDMVEEDDITNVLVSIGAEYYHEFVTYEYDLEQDGAVDMGQLEFGCYKLLVYDTCLTTGQELITNGNFGDGDDDWNFAAYGNSYTTAGGTLAVTFNPLQGPNLITNGDFSGGATGWTLGAGWGIAGGGAQHTPGSTATLTQTITVDIITKTQLWVQITISGRTAGSVQMECNGQQSNSFAVNQTIVTMIPLVAGANVFTFTPTSAFDGTIDDVSVYEQYNIAPYFIATNVANPSMTDGNYAIEAELVATPSSDARGIQPTIAGATEPGYDNTVGVIVNNFPNYVPGTQQGRVWMSWISESITGHYVIGTIEVDNVSMYAVEPFEATYISECFMYKEFFTNSKMFIGYCDHNAFGYNFVDTGFKFTQRIKCRSFGPDYEKNKKIFNHGNGESGIYYADQTKWAAVYLDLIPESAHDMMSIMMDCTHFLIGDSEDNGVEYIAKPEDYTPDWDRGGLTNLATSRFEVKPKEKGQVFNRDC